MRYEILRFFGVRSMSESGLDSETVESEVCKYIHLPKMLKQPQIKVSCFSSHPRITNT